MGLKEADGSVIYDFATRLFPICRSITGNGVRETLGLIQAELGTRLHLNVCEVPSGSTCFDWTVPDEWNIRDAFVLDDSGKRVIDFSANNLHVVNYSVPVDKECSLDELQSHLFSLPDQPQAIPYVTSYYKPFWGFCLTHEQRQTLRPGTYRAVVDSTLKPGSLTYADLVIEGSSSEEILLSTYVCHPSMANNECSGPALVTYLAKWISELQDRHYTYRIVFVPETIGAITYLSQHLEHLKANVKAGFVLTCVGDNKGFSYLPSRLGGTLADKIAEHTLKHHVPEFKRYRYADRGSDERQYCSPGVDLPVVSMMRTKYGEYPEYHTSLDNLDFVSREGFDGAFNLYRKAIRLLEANFKYKVTCLCEPQLGKRGLYPSIGTPNHGQVVRNMLNLVAYSDGEHDLIDIAEQIEIDAQDLIVLADNLKSHGLLMKV
jgi:aminopeptidase-like protein